MVSGEVEPVSDGGGDGTHSVYATALLRELRDPDADIIDVYGLHEAVRSYVFEATDQQQAPDLGHMPEDEKGRFFFIVQGAE